MDRKQLYIAERTARYSGGQISRRSFITSLVGAGIAVPAALGMASRVEAQTPQRGGTYRHGMAFGSTTDSLDPGTYENGMMTQVSFSYGNCLTEVAPDMSLRAELAESYEPREEGAVWAFTLRPDVTFHNGKTLNADDVIATMNYHRGENSSSAAKGILSPVVNITKEGDNVVVFELDGPNADFPYIVSDYHLIILPSEDGETIDPTAGIGTGGYSMVNFEPGVRFQGTRNPDYFKSDAAYFDDMELLSIIDTTARQNALMSGEVQVADRLDPKTVALMARNPNLEILEKTGYLHYTFPMRLDSPPFDNYDLRMALKLAVNRQEMVDKILLGHGTIGNDHPISPSVPYWADLPQREYDPEQARFHYERSGHSGALQLSASDAAFAGAVDAAQLIQASAAAAGIEVEIVREPADGYWSNVWNKKPWCACYWGGRPTQDWMYTSGYTNDIEWNDTAWTGTEASERFNMLVDEARGELDEARRAEMYAECQTLIHDDGGAIVPMFANYIMGVGGGVTHGEDVASNWINDGNKSHERWWMS
ncbi:ABC transporter substrate-binding protein [Wenxinia saemankumensis]|uniref:Peptide/nickel transport system substrate-binding protein n=1 Tax=Wenxinia saemankumensis TaxID=1447782 RepID=A0A1M6E0A7_9RHOB|nr:ABC transporter substrate-binding protein [Wenxinia saemankumensis]SHI78833.1 peptide/nickel transport system substrate-binding protein [Wenxinia saemankumensis]